MKQRTPAPPALPASPAFQASVATLSRLCSNVAMTVPAKRAPSGDQTALLRKMPSVDELLQLPTVAQLCSEIDRGLVVDITRQVLSQLRREIAAGDVSAEQTISPAALEERIVQAVQQELAPSLQPVINASGVILHTNLGRAPLPAQLVDELCRTATQYSNLEYNLVCRRSRQARRSHQLDCSRAYRRRRRHRRKQLRRGRPAHSRGPGSWRRSDCFSRRADRNRRWLSHPGNHGAKRRHPSRSRHHQSHPPARLRKRHQRKNARAAARASVQFSSDRLRGKARRSPNSAELGERANPSRWWRTSAPALSSICPPAVSRNPPCATASRPAFSLVMFSGDKLLGGPQAGIIAGQKRFGRNGAPPSTISRAARRQAHHRRAWKLP